MNRMGFGLVLKAMGTSKHSGLGFETSVVRQMKLINYPTTQMDLLNNNVGKVMIYTDRETNIEYNFVVKIVEVTYHLIENEVRCRGVYYYPTDSSKLPQIKVYSTNCKSV